MMIVNKSENMIVNIQQITHMYVTSNTAIVAADLTNGGHTNLGQYNSMLEAQTALEMLIYRIGNVLGEIVPMPSDNEVKEKINLKEVKENDKQSRN